MTQQLALRVQAKTAGAGLQRAGKIDVEYGIGVAVTASQEQVHVTVIAEPPHLGEVPALALHRGGRRNIVLLAARLSIQNGDAQERGLPRSGLGNPSGRRLDLFVDARGGGAGHFRMAHNRGRSGAGKCCLDR